MLKDLYVNRALIWDLSKNDFKTKYANSYLGIIWAFIQPIITLLIYWVVFQYGLKIGTPTEGVPYILWFTTGMVPWFFFSEAISAGVNCLMEYNYLVKKLVFNVAIIPIIKVISTFFVHLVFIGFMLLIYSFYGRLFTINYLLLAYYLVALLVLIVGLDFLISATVVFFRDFGQIVNIILQIGMWATPILWNYQIIPEKFLWIMKLNPLFYIVEGYRSAFLNEMQNNFLSSQTIIFWIICLSMLAIGIKVFNKMKPHFADVL